MERWGDDTGDRRAVLPPPSPDAAVAAEPDTIETGPPGRDRSRVEVLLDDLARAELVEPRAESRLAGEPEWSFRHALVQEAAYATLTGADRALGHRLAGEWLESAGEREALVLAEHHERGGDREGAIGWFRAAAEEALEGNDFVGAIARAERGVACGAEGEAKGELRVLQAEASYWKGELRECLERATEAAELVQRPSVPWLAALRLVATAASPLGSHDILEATARRLVVTHVQEAHRDAFVRTAAVSSAYLLHAGMADHAEVLLHRADAIASNAQNLHRGVLARLRFARGVQARLAGDVTAYLDACTEAAGLAEDGGDLRYAAAQRQNIGFGCLELGDNARALAVVEQSYSELERLGLEPVRASALVNAGVAALRLGDAAGAVERARRAVSIATRHGNRRHEGNARIVLAESLRCLGLSAEAMREARAAVEALRATPASLPHAHALVADLLLSENEIDAARIEVDAATESWRATTQVPARAMLVRLVKARVCLAMGAHAEARAEVVAAVAELETRADRIADPDLRARFTTAIPEHRDVLLLAHQLGIRLGQVESL
jgi:tetratricopeptide (TPR) repeat protein